MQTYILNTKNALEATNRVIKDDGTFREINNQHQLIDGLNKTKILSVFMTIIKKS
jgi:hypothetical protein